MSFSISESAAIIVGQLAKHLKEDKTVNSFFDDFTAATVEWLRPLFLVEEDKPTSAVKKLINGPESTTKQELLKAIILAEIEDEPLLEQKSITLAEQIRSKDAAEGLSANSQRLGKNNKGNILMQDFKAGGAIKVNINKRPDEGKDK